MIEDLFYCFCGRIESFLVGFDNVRVILKAYYKHFEENEIPDSFFWYVLSNRINLIPTEDIKVVVNYWGELEENA